MKFLDSLRSRMSGQTKEEFGFGQQFPLTKSMMQVVRRHMSEHRSTDLTKYTFERRHSDYKDTKSDLVIYDANGKPVLHGREGSDGNLSIWPI